ncbi:geobacillin-26 family protein [Cytobacillus horneckiae]|uniref:geobacillin-26 family protein n=1 Tax=Cytobacillus horneckiae TaxID=549687 RepID=UPI003D9A358A
MTEKSSNKSNLSKFKSSVDKLNTAEWKYLGLSFTVPIGTAATVVAAAINGGAAIAVGLVTAGIVGAAARAALDMHRHAKDVHYCYFTV